MQIDQLVTIAATSGAIIASIAAVVQSRRKPKLDDANIDQIKRTVAKADKELNLARDLRILDLERWGDAMRPWASAVAYRDDQMIDLIREDRERCKLPMPEIPPLPPMPEFPVPRPLTMDK